MSEISVQIDTTGAEASKWANTLAEDEAVSGQTYDGLSNNDILETAYGEKVWQLSKYAGMDASLAISMDGKVSSQLTGHPRFILGTITEQEAGALRPLVHDSEVQLSVKIGGGTYKQAVESDDGSLSVKTFREPLALSITVSDVSANNTDAVVPAQDVEWSAVGQKMYADGQKPYCTTCKQPLKGERICPNCGIRIIYPGENPDGTPKSGFEKTVNGALKVSHGLEKAGDGLSKFGCAATLGCTIPIIILLFLLGIL
ncbi:zinc ribbon domain-containing protein [Lacticaseibacillus salsurivasis]|uniref:zinc ribbon domain-containing protein n=1 Tax=Lacticaseibacillus salsurivasis TaxID=3081441 RepID=UPI0030C70AC0